MRRSSKVCLSELSTRRRVRVVTVHGPIPCGRQSAPGTPLRRIVQLIRGLNLVITLGMHDDHHSVPQHAEGHPPLLAAVCAIILAGEVGRSAQEAWKAASRPLISIFDIFNIACNARSAACRSEAPKSFGKICGTICQDTP